MTIELIKEILSIFATTASTVIIAIVAALMIYGFKVLCNRFGINIKNDTMTDIIGIVSQVIKYLDQKFVDTIKKNSSDGTLTDYQKEMVKSKCVDMLKSLLNSNQIEFLLKKYNMAEIDDVLDILIESTINDIRTNNNNNDTIIISDNITENAKHDEDVATVYNATDEELESIAICPGNCISCSLSSECIICRE